MLQGVLFEERPVPVEAETEWARRLRLTAHAEIAARMEESLASILAIARAGHTLKCSFSGGKDSSLLLCLALEALRVLKAEGGTVPRLVVTSADTGIENPEVVAAVKMALAAVRETAAIHGLEVECKITHPRLSEDWWVRILGGDQLPSFVGGSAKCSMDMKVMPQSRLARKLDAELKKAGLPPSVTLIGTRFSESSKRKANMVGRNESATTPQLNDIGGTSVLVLAPIAHWETETVFAYLQDAGRTKRYPGYAESFASLYGLYDSASGGNCVLYTDPGMQTRRSAGCSARFGCTVCQMVETDHSLKNLLMLDEFQYLKGMYRLREYLKRTRFDYSRRRWFGRTVDPATGDLTLHVATYSAAECEALLRMLLTLDKRERERAERVQAQLAAGELEPTEANRRAAQVRFRNLSLRQLAAIDALWSINVSHPPHHAWHVLHQVLDGSGEMEVPEVEETPRAAPPLPRVLPGNRRLWEGTTGLRDIMQEMVYFEGEGWTYLEKDGRIEPIPQFPDGDFFEIDEESLDMFLQFELDIRLQETAGLGPHHALNAIRFYHRYGTVTYSHQRAYLIQRRIERAEYWLSFGLAGDLSLEQMARLTVPKTDAPAGAPVVVAAEGLLEAA